MGGEGEPGLDGREVTAVSHLLLFKVLFFSSTSPRPTLSYKMQTRTSDNQEAAGATG